MEKTPLQITKERTTHPDKAKHIIPYKTKKSNKVIQNSDEEELSQSLTDSYISSNNELLTKFESCVKVNDKALHAAAQSGKKDLFTEFLPLFRRNKATLEIAQILLGNIEKKRIGNTNYLTLPILTQAYGAGKTYFLKNLPELFKTYCPEIEELKESYYIYVDLRKLHFEPGSVNSVIERLYSLIFSSFLEKYDAAPENIPRSLDMSNIKLLARFIRRNNDPGEFEQLLRQLHVKEHKINLIVGDFEDKKFSHIIFLIDELKRAESKKIYSEKEKEEINERIEENRSNMNMNQKYLPKLVRLYYFWDLISNLMINKYFELIVAGKGTSGLLGKKIPFDSCSPSGITQIILDPLTREDIYSMIDDVLVKSNILDKKVSLRYITQEIFSLTHGHPLYVGFSIYYYYTSILKKETDFNLKNKLTDDKVVIRHISDLKENLKIYEGLLGLRKFFYDILKGKKMKKKTRHKIAIKPTSYESTIELLDILGISYSNGEVSIITPILPGIFESEYFEFLFENFSMGPVENALFYEKLFGESFLNFSRDLYDDSTDKPKNIDIKKMFSFLRKFPKFDKSGGFIDQCVELPKILKTGKKKSVVKEFDLLELETLNISNYNKILKILDPNRLYKHRGLSCSSDYVYLRTFFNGEKKLFLFFQIKSVKTKVDILEEYKKVFIDTKLKLQKDCLYRLIIFNNEDSNLKFINDEAYKEYSYNNNKLEKANNVDEMETKVLTYYVNPKEVEKFHNLEVMEAEEESD